MKICLLYSDVLKDYDFGLGHPFRGDRFDSFIAHFKETLYKSGKFDLVMKNKPARDEDLLLWHKKDYIEAVQAASLGRSVQNLWKLMSEDNMSPITRRFPQGIERAARVIVKNSITSC